MCRFQAGLFAADIFDFHKVIQVNVCHTVACWHEPQFLKTKSQRRNLRLDLIKKGLTAGHDQNVLHTQRVKRMEGLRGSMGRVYKLYHKHVMARSDPASCQCCYITAVSNLYWSNANVKGKHSLYQIRLNIYCSVAKRPKSLWMTCEYGQ